MNNLGELEVISHYLEDGRLNVLLAPRDEASRERVHLELHPRSRRIARLWRFTSAAAIAPAPWTPSRSTRARLVRIARGIR